MLLIPVMRDDVDSCTVRQSTTNTSVVGYGKRSDLNEAAVPYFASAVSSLQAQDACSWEKGEGNVFKT